MTDSPFNPDSRNDNNGNDDEDNASIVTTSDDTNHPLSKLHTIDEASQPVLNAILQSVQQRREAERLARPSPAPKRNNKLIQFMTGKKKAGREERKKDERQNENLRLRLHKLEMDKAELNDLKVKVEQLEWALDAVRDDADKVRDDALAVLSQYDDALVPSPQ